MSETASAAAVGQYPRRWLAVLLSIVWPGLGFAYLGRWRMALAVFALVLGLWWVLVILALNDRLSLVVFAALFAATLLSWLGAIVAAFIVSRRPAAPVRPRYSRWYGLLAIAVVWHLCWFFTPVPIEAYSIPASSMVPTLQVGDRLIALHWRHIGELPKRGEIVIFRVPQLNVDYIKRVIGLPGDTVQLVNNVVMVNGQALPQKPLGELAYGGGASATRYRQFEERSPDGVAYRVLTAPSASPFASTKPFVVPPGHLFVLGDNRDNSQDSRFAEIGFVAREDLRALPLFLYYARNIDRIGQKIR